MLGDKPGEVGRARVRHLFGLYHKSTAAAATANSLQLCPTLCNPIDGGPPGSPVYGIFQARVLEWGAVWSLAKGNHIFSAHVTK